MKTWKLLMSNNFSICWYNPTSFSVNKHAAHDKAEMNQGTGTQGFVQYLIQQGEVNFLQWKLIPSQDFVKIEICYCGKAGQNIPGVLTQQEV